MSCLLKNTSEETSLSSPALRLRLGMGRVNQSDQVTLPRSEPLAISSEVERFS